MTLIAGRHTATFTVSIRNDNDLEGTEDFSLELEIPLSAARWNVIEGPRNKTTVYIRDDGEYCSSALVCSNHVPETCAVIVCCYFEYSDSFTHSYIHSCTFISIKILIWYHFVILLNTQIDLSCLCSLAISVYGSMLQIDATMHHLSCSRSRGRGCMLKDVWPKGHCQLLAGCNQSLVVAVLPVLLPA